MQVAVGSLLVHNLVYRALRRPQALVLQKGLSSQSCTVRKQAVAASGHDPGPAPPPNAPSLPRFFADKQLPLAAGPSVVLSEEESRHATKALRLSENDPVELFDGLGRLAQGRLEASRKQASVYLENVRQVPWELPKWTVAVSMSDLSSSRADWLVEKATELGAWSLQPFASQHSHKGGIDRSSKKVDRWRSVSLAACKQSRRLHQLTIAEPITFAQLLQTLQHGQKAQMHTLVALQGGEPLPAVAATIFGPSYRPPLQAIANMLVVGPEGDFTEQEKRQLLGAGALAVGLGPLRLRVETAAVAALANLMLL